MSATPRTDAAIIAANGRWTYELKDEMQAMERELAAAKERIRLLEQAHRQDLDDAIALAQQHLNSYHEAKERLDSLRKAVAKQNEEICQGCGKALGYPWFKDDQKNFPGATEDCGVCVGEHVAVTIVEELVMEYGKANDRIMKLNEESESRWKMAEAAISSCAELVESIRRLEEAGDKLTNCIACGCNDGGCRTCRETEDNWIKAKETK